ncbi:glycosyltransferase family 2 protein [Candidatus Viadribacter manganicus]|uniref:Glycosyl transferase n=1 Tax=Candidatus Viadribacter manganicus TaxID=1759059 RepID=A0A1B1AGS1_9PROT|nr:glycosyltransferase family 2 protein [Candidatus Viadribacter manganicus]ANP45754.1 glycosyl transferase [Candidatus Viadribacter manganicus]
MWTPSLFGCKGSSLSPRISIVIAVLDEAENVASVAAEIISAFENSGSFEIVFVDDGSSDDTVSRIRTLPKDLVRLVRHEKRCGKSQAVRSGVAAAHGEWIGTMDGDGQDDPVDIAKMLSLALAAGGSPLVAGVRAKRNDPWPRLVATKIGNGIRQALLNDGCPDTACGLKVFKREAFLQLPVFEGMHRFLPALFRSYGHDLVLHEVNHRPRAAGHSKYTNWGRALVGVGDLAGVMWLRSRTRAPRFVEPPSA